MLMMNDRHFSLAKVLRKSVIKNLHQLLRPLVVFASSTCEVAVDDHEALVLYLKPDTDCALIACHTGSTSLDFARLERLRRNARGQLSFEEYREVAADHLLVCIHQLLVVILFLFVCLTPHRFLVRCLHGFGQHGPPHFQLFLVGDHHILGVKRDHLLQRYNIHIGDKVDLLALRIPYLEYRQELIDRVWQLPTAIQRRAVDIQCAFTGPPGAVQGCVERFLGLLERINWYLMLKSAFDYLLLKVAIDLVLGLSIGEGRCLQLVFNDYRLLSLHHLEVIIRSHHFINWSVKLSCLSDVIQQKWSLELNKL